MVSKFPDKIREAWGYNDALLHSETRYVPLWHSGPRDTHFDKSYVRGYYRGMDDAKASVSHFECGLSDCSLCAAKGESK